MAANNFQLSVKAEQDMENIYRFHYEEHGVARAENCILDLSVAFRRLAGANGSAQDCGDVSDGLLSRQAAAHVIYFKHGADGVKIIRVLHQSLHDMQH